MVLKGKGGIKKLVNDFIKPSVRSHETTLLQSVTVTMCERYKGLGTTERTYRGVLLGKPCDSSSLPRLRSKIVLSWAIFLWKNAHNSPSLQGAGKLQIDRDLRSGWIFLFFKAAAVRIKGNLGVFKKEIKKYKVFTDFFSKFYFFSSFTSL